MRQPFISLQDKSVEDAAKLFAEADANKDNKLSREEVTGLLKKVRALGVMRAVLDACGCGGVD